LHIGTGVDAAILYETLTIFYREFVPKHLGSTQALLYNTVTHAESLIRAAQEEEA
jgi:hypothetical protein